MSYDVGTHISFKTEPEPEPVQRLYVPGTRIIFVNLIEGLTQIVQPKFSVA